MNCSGGLFCKFSRACREWYNSVCTLIYRIQLSDQIGEGNFITNLVTYARIS